MVVVLGKSRKNVKAYILLPPDCQSAIQLLINLRSLVGIAESNKYVFARMYADTPLSGTSDLRDVVKKCPLIKYPNRISSTKLRKYIATVSQV
jgi:hypothetical protein